MLKQLHLHHLPKSGMQAQSCQIVPEEWHGDQDLRNTTDIWHLLRPIRFPNSWILIIPLILDSITPYIYICHIYIYVCMYIYNNNHQSRGRLNTAHQKLKALITASSTLHQSRREDHYLMHPQLQTHAMINGNHQCTPTEGGQSRSSVI